MKKTIVVIFMLSILSISVFAQSAQPLDIKAVAGQLTPKNPFHLLDLLFDDISLAFSGNAQSKLTVANERFAEAIVDDDTPSVARGNKLLLEVESTTNLSLNSSDEIHARIVLAKVIQRLAVDRAERNQSMPTGLLLAFDRLQILSGRIVEAENGSRFKEIKLQCNLQGLTFVACTQTSNGICGVPSCIAQNPVNVNASIQCPPGSQYQGICTLSFPKVCSSVCICGLDGRPYENSKCANHSITTCVFGSGMLVNNQLACDKMTNNIVTCKFGEIIDTGRRCGIQGIFGGNR